MDGLIKKRTIKVKGLYREKCERKINNVLSKIDGIKEVKAGKVYLKYDLLKINLENIEKQIIKLGYELSKKFLVRMNRGMIHCAKQNE